MSSESPSRASDSWEIVASNVRSILFDAGHTLVFPDFDVYREVVSSFGGGSPDWEKIQAAELVARHEFEKFSLERMEISDAWSAFYQIMFRLLGVPTDSLLDAVRALHRRHLQGFGLWNRPAEGASETLEALAEAGYIVGVVSNSDGRVEQGLEAVGLTTHLSFILDSEIVGIAKPDPRIFHLALERAGVTPEEAVYVGDYVSVDVVGARAAGIMPILYDPPGAYAHPGCPVIRELAELVRFFPPRRG